VKQQNAKACTSPTRLGHEDPGVFDAARARRGCHWLVSVPSLSDLGELVGQLLSVGCGGERGCGEGRDYRFDEADASMALAGANDAEQVGGRRARR